MQDLQCTHTHTHTHTTSTPRLLPQTVVHNDNHAHSHTAHTHTHTHTRTRMHIPTSLASSPASDESAQDTSTDTETPLQNTAHAVIDVSSTNLRRLSIDSKQLAKPNTIGKSLAETRSPFKVTEASRQRARRLSAVAQAVSVPLTCTQTADKAHHHATRRTRRWGISSAKIKRGMSWRSLKRVA